MKAEGKKDGFIHITPQTICEAFALVHLTQGKNAGQMPIVINLSMLEDILCQEQ